MLYEVVDMRGKKRLNCQFTARLIEVLKMSSATLQRNFESKGELGTRENL